MVVPRDFNFIINIFNVLVDGSRAGSGNLEILVNGGRVTSSVRALGGQRFVASFTPHEVGVHSVQITFNGDTVPGKLNLSCVHACNIFGANHLNDFPQCTISLRSAKIPVCSL